jgi:glycosyltransferase involved in cell wall biosynthesis
MHNQPQRLATVRHLAESADLIYVSTDPLGARLREQGFTTPIRPGRIYCSGSVINPAELRPVTRIGYMGFDHAHDFKLAIPALLRFMDAYPHVTFELFGSIPKPPELERLGERIRVVPPVRDYAEFLRHFASLNWDIGICPLADMPFNAVKANTKWVEYTSVGAAVIATAGTIYDECVSGGCGLLAETDDQWFRALDQLTSDPQARHAMVQRAQRKVEAEYSVPRLRDQVLGVLEEASQHAAARPAAAKPMPLVGVPGS